MKPLTINRFIFIAGILTLFLSCRKAAVAPYFSANIGGTAYAFDSLFAYVDTSSRSNNYIFITIGAKDTKANNTVVIGGFAYETNDITGSYFYSSQLPFPIPSLYKQFNQTIVVINGSTNAGSYALGGSGVSNYNVDDANQNRLKGTFSVLLNPRFTNGSVNTSQSLQMTGQFDVSYHFIP